MKFFTSQEVIKQHAHRLGEVLIQKYDLIRTRLNITAFTISPFFIMLIFAIFMFFLGVTGLFSPMDDLHRHLKSSQYGYDYRNLFIYSYHPAYNTYIGFDYIASFLYSMFGNHAAIFFQIIPFLITSLAIIRMSETADDNLTSVIVLIVFYFIWDRFLSGRPCIMVSSLFLLAYAHKDIWPRSIHLLLGCIMGSLYYLFFLYTIPLSFAKKVRISYICATFASFVFWYFYSSGEFFQDIFMLARSADISSIGMVYAELSPILSFAILPSLTPFFPFFLFWKKDLLRSVMILFFILLNKVRYLETAIPLAVSFLQFLNWKVPTLLVIAILTLILKNIQPIPPHNINLPEGSVVMATSSVSMNSVVAGSDNIKIVPSANLGWNDLGIVSGISQITNTGTFDCSLLEKFHFDYVIENRLKEVPTCLTLKEFKGPFRIWETKPEKLRVVGIPGHREQRFPLTDSK